MAKHDGCNTNNAGDDNEFYPFYVVKNRPSLSRRRSSVQSYSKRHKIKLVRRLVRKSGKSSIHQKSSKERSFRFLLDLSNTLIESGWLCTILVVAFVFILTWLMFAGFWAIISIENVDAWNGTSSSCLEGIESFSGYLLFSIETQTTVGYGGRYINESCPEAIIGLIIQLIIGAGVGGSLICIIFLKMVGPLKYRHSTVCFSRYAVICQRDGELCLIFRVRDYDMRYECHTNIVAYLAEEKAGELSLKTLKLERTGILIWPVEVVHRIDESSPFWDLSAKDLLLRRFEIIAVLEGECSATSYLSRTTTSYLSREIKWGFIFSPCTRWDKEDSQYVVDHKRFNKTEEMTIPLCSAQRLDQVYDDIVYHTRSASYPASEIFSAANSSKQYSNPSSVASPRYYRKSDMPEELREGSSSSAEDAEEKQIARDSTKVQVHVDTITDDSDEEEYATFMDMSIEELSKWKRKKKKRKLEDVEVRKKSPGGGEGRTSRGLSGTAKDFLASLQRYVSEGASRSRTSRQFEETDF
ncbi:ATP-sensitive inward rectifier potassium channel 11-like [Euwallacea fornicatus]|uniref:ATP-sensitive inward rectifier potassium channel 11-like n=1 Tax=Euwallacea fornicatus TaxID=995702 RepID=UPI00338DB6D1